MISRRDFLKTSSAALAGASLVGCSGKGRVKRICWGINRFRSCSLGFAGRLAATATFAFAAVNVGASASVIGAVEAPIAMGSMAVYDAPPSTYRDVTINGTLSKLGTWLLRPAGLIIALFIMGGMLSANRSLAATIQPSGTPGAIEKPIALPSSTPSEAHRSPNSSAVAFLLALLLIAGSIGHNRNEEPFSNFDKLREIIRRQPPAKSLQVQEARQDALAQLDVAEELFTSDQPRNGEYVGAVNKLQADLIKADLYRNPPGGFRGGGNGST